MVNLTYSVTDQAGLIDGDALLWYLDVDGQTTTGAPNGYVGTDYAIARIGAYSLLTRYEPSTATFQSVKEVPSAGAFGVDLDVSALVNYGTRAMTVAGATSWKPSASGTTYYDRVPEPGQKALAFTAATFEQPVPTPAAAPVAQAPAPAPAPVPVPVPAPVSVAAPAASPVAVAPASAGASATECEIPAVRRLKLAEARAAVRAAGCKVGRVTKKTSKVIKAGRVVQGNRYPGEAVALGTKVDLIVSTGKPRTARRLTHLSVAAQAQNAVNEVNNARG